MKRWFLLLLSAALLLLVSSCGKSVVLSVDATIMFDCTDGMSLRLGPVTYEGFGGRSLKKSDIEYIFYDLCNQTDKEFDTATLYLSVYNNLTDELLSEEQYTFRKKTGRAGTVYGMD